MGLAGTAELRHEGNEGHKGFCFGFEGTWGSGVAGAEFLGFKVFVGFAGTAERDMEFLGFKDFVLGGGNARERGRFLKNLCVSVLKKQKARRSRGILIIFTGTRFCLWAATFPLFVQSVLRFS